MTRASAAERPIELDIPRPSPLAGVARQGRFGAPLSAPGVMLSVRHPLSIVTIIARQGQTDALAAALQAATGIALPAPGHAAMSKSVSLQWCGADQWYAVAQGRGEGALYRDLRARLDGLAAVIDQSHGRIVISVAGPKSRDVLAKGTAVDLHPRVFGPGRCAVTQMAHVGVHLAQTGPDAFDLSFFRSFAESFWDWLTTQAEEFGYEVR